MVVRTVAVNDAALELAHDLRKQLEAVGETMNRLAGMGIVTKFSFSLGPDGKQTLSQFEILAPVNLKQ